MNLQQTRISIQKIEDATRFVAYNTYLVYRKFMNCRNTKAKSFKENPTETVVGRTVYERKRTFYRD